MLSMILDSEKLNPQYNHESSYGVWGSAISSSSGVWGGAPAEIEFGAF